ncbi:MAG: choice-of-anchor D domain-containing protein [Spirochaetes bacterium]|nr:choice-of-anchor D domain-containing protein [Spirochaetota bacterium]HOD16054.1 choice-of-anchor D domain-containing protein [Spirochaetota bacterium]
MKNLLRKTIRFAILGVLAVSLSSCESMLGDMENDIAAMKQQMMSLLDLRPLPEISLFNGADEVKPGELIDMGFTTTTTAKWIDLTVRNTGVEDVNLEVITMTGKYADRFAISGITLPQTLAPSTQTVFRVNFQSLIDNDGYRAAVVSISTGPDYTPYNVTVACERTEIPQGKMEVKRGNTTIPDNDAQPYNIGTVDAQVLCVFTVKNNGTWPITIDAINTVMSDGSVFILDTVPSAPIPAGGSAPLIVDFQYMAPGTYYDTIIIAYDDGVDPACRYRAYISGTSTTLPIPDIDVVDGSTSMTSGQSHNFGSQLLGTQSDPASLLVLNLGTGDLNITGISLASGQHFTCTGPATPCSVAPGDYVVLNITYHPMTADDHFTTLTIDSNDGADPGFQIILEGDSVQPDICVHEGGTCLAAGPHPSHDFGGVSLNGQSPDKNYTIRNDGTYDLSIYSITLSDTDNYTLQWDTPDTLLSPDESTTITLRYNPTSVGSHNSYVTINTSDPGLGSFIIDLTGHSLQPGIEILNPGGSDFPSGYTYTFGSWGADGDVHHASDWRMFTIHNNGTAPLVINSLNWSGSDYQHYDIDTTGMPGMPATIPIGGSATFRLRFDPLDYAIELKNNAAITISSTATNTPSYVINLAGNARQPRMNINIRVASMWYMSAWNGDFNAYWKITASSTAEAASPAPSPWNRFYGPFIANLDRGCWEDVAYVIVNNGYLATEIPAPHNRDQAAYCPLGGSQWPATMAGIQFNNIPMEDNQGITLYVLTADEDAGDPPYDEVDDCVGCDANSIYYPMVMPVRYHTGSHTLTCSKNNGEDKVVSGVNNSYQEWVVNADIPTEQILYLYTKRGLRVDEGGPSGEGEIVVKFGITVSYVLY